MRLLLFFGLSISLFFHSLNTQAQTPPYAKIEIPVIGDNIQKLAAKGVPVDHLKRTQSSIIGEFSSEETQTIKKLIPEAKILVPDVTKLYHALQASAERQVKPNYAPQGFELGSMGGYFTLQEIDSIFDVFVSNFPQYVSKKDTIGYSIEGRPIYYIRVSDNPNVEQPGRRQILYNSLTHAREPMSVTQMIYFLWYLLENPTQTDIASILSERELYFIPVINPDGYLYNQTIEPNGGGMWRKNRRLHNDGEIGVDLNRNFGYNWGYDSIGSSAHTSSNVYRGESAFSEPETQAIRDFVKTKNFHVAMNYHSYGNLMIFAWGYTQEACEDSAYHTDLGIHMTEFNWYEVGQGSRVLYFTNGDINDWMYGDTVSKNKIFSYVPEVGDPDYGFWPPENLIIPYAEDNLEQNIRVANGIQQATSAKAKKTKAINLFPNPVTNGIVNFNVDGITEFKQIEIFNNLGARVILKQVIETPEIDLNKLKSGYYVIRVTSKDNGVFLGEILVN